MILAANLLWVSLRQSRSLAVRRKRAMLSSVSSVMPSPSSGHGAAIAALARYFSRVKMMNLPLPAHLLVNLCVEPRTGMFASHPKAPTAATPPRPRACPGTKTMGAPFRAWLRRQDQGAPYKPNSRCINLHWRKGRLSVRCWHGTTTCPLRSLHSNTKTNNPSEHQHSYQLPSQQARLDHICFYLCFWCTNHHLV